MKGPLDRIVLEEPCVAVAGREKPTPSVPRRTLHVPQAMNEAYHYAKPSAFSRGVVVPMGDATFVFVSGTAAVGPNGESLHGGDFAAQARRAFENARDVLRSAGAGWCDVVKVTIYLRDIAATYAALNDARSAFFRDIGLDEYPASTCIEATLCRDELLVEMDLVAVVKATEKGEVL